MPTWMRPLALWLRLAPWRTGHGACLGQGCLPVNPWWGVQGLGTCMKNKWVAIDKATKAPQLAASIEIESEAMTGSWSVWVFTVSTIASTSVEVYYFVLIFIILYLRSTDFEVLILHAAPLLPRFAPLPWTAWMTLCRRSWHPWAA